MADCVRLDLTSPLSFSLLSLSLSLSLFLFLSHSLFSRFISLSRCFLSMSFILFILPFPPFPPAVLRRKADLSLVQLPVSDDYPESIPPPRAAPSFRNDTFCSGTVTVLYSAVHNNTVQYASTMHTQPGHTCCHNDTPVLHFRSPSHIDRSGSFALAHVMHFTRTSLPFL